jgi:hypothetical protein
MTRFWAFLFLLTFAPVQAYGQAVSDSSFCLDVQNNACVNPLPHGVAVRLNALKMVDSHRTVYFWASIDSSDYKAIAFMFQREGTCTVEQYSLPARKFGERPGVFNEIKGFFEGKTLANLWDLLGMKEAAPSIKDFKLNVAFVPPSSGFRVSVWRHLGCSGVMRARLFNSKGEPLPGDNGVREIKIVE